MQEAHRMNHGKEEKKEKVRVSWAATFLPRWRDHGEAARDADRMAHPTPNSADSKEVGRCSANQKKCTLLYTLLDSVGERGSPW